MTERPVARFAASLRDLVSDFIGFAGRRFALAAALVVSGAIFEGLGLALLVPLLALVTSSGAGGGGLRRMSEAVFGAVGAQTPFERLALLVAVFGAVMLVRGVIVAWRDVLLAALQIGFLESLRGDVAGLLAAARWDQLARLRHARVTHMMSGDLQRIGAGANFLLQTVVAVVTLVAQCALALFLSPVLAVIALGSLAIVGLSLGPIVSRSQRLGEYVTAANLSLLDAAGQFLGGLKLAVGQNLQSAFAQQFRDQLQQLARRQIDNTRQRTLMRFGLNALSAAVAGAIVLVGFGVMRLPAAVLGALILVVARMSGPVGRIQQGLQQVALALPAYDKVSELKAELAAAKTPAAPGVDARSPEGDIAFEHVSFEHPDQAGEAILGRGVRDLSLTVRAGDFVGVTGSSGAGKTTFADLLVGLFQPQRGRITVGGQPLEGDALKAWRDGLAYVSQDPFLFHDTVRRNLAWASPDASEDEMWRALALAGADELVRRMEHGLESVVGERGALVSGGERQRIALARAVLRRPRLLVLDEATNAIDVATERDILGRLAALRPAPTIVLVAHRAESLAFCRTVVRLEDGAMAGEGDAMRLAAGQ